jgi:hypothetical protein
MREHVITLDRPRRLQLNDYALERLAGHYSMPIPAAVAAVRREPKMKMAATYLWLLAVTEDQDLTVERMENIIDSWLGNDPIGRHRRLAELARSVIRHVKELRQEG